MGRSSEIETPRGHAPFNGQAPHSSPLLALPVASVLAKNGPLPVRFHPDLNFLSDGILPKDT